MKVVEGKLPEVEWDENAAPGLQVALTSSSDKIPEKASRPRFEHIYMALAFQMARRSTCNRLAVGCAITSTDFRKVLAVGYNGNASGLANHCDSATPGTCGCLHAEENAVINCDVARDVPKFVFCTHLTCLMRAKRLINLGGVKKIYYEHDYRMRDSIRVLNEVHIPIVQLDGWVDQADRWWSRIDGGNMVSK